MKQPDGALHTYGGFNVHNLIFESVGPPSSSLLSCSLIDTSYLRLLRPAPLRSLICHSGLGKQMSPVRGGGRSAFLCCCFLLIFLLCLFYCSVTVLLCGSLQHDSQWSPSPCTVCVCSRGSMSCSARSCPPLTCPGDQSLFTPAGECCPKCGRNGGESQSSLGRAGIIIEARLTIAIIESPKV